MLDRRIWFATKFNQWSWHADDGNGAALCRRDILAATDTRETRSELGIVRGGYRHHCKRCAAILADRYAELISLAQVALTYHGREFARLTDPERGLLARDLARGVDAGDLPTPIFIAVVELRRRIGPEKVSRYLQVLKGQAERGELI